LLLLFLCWLLGQLLLWFTVIFGLFFLDDLSCFERLVKLCDYLQHFIDTFEGHMIIAERLIKSLAHEHRIGQS